MHIYYALCITYMATFISDKYIPIKDDRKGQGFIVWTYTCTYKLHLNEPNPEILETETSALSVAQVTHEVGVTYLLYTPWRSPWAHWIRSHCKPLGSIWGFIAQIRDSDPCIFLTGSTKSLLV